MLLQNVANTMTVVENFRGEGVNFFDINSLLMDREADKSAMDWSAKLIKENFEFDMIAGLDARGFLFKTLADRLNKPFTMIRKSGKLPNSIVSESYETEYSTDVLSISKSIPKGKRILLIDDVVVTGNSLLTAARLIEQIECEVVGCFSLVEITNHPRRNSKLNDLKIVSLFKYLEDAKSTLLDPTLNSVLQKERFESYKMKRYYPLEPVNNANFDTVVLSHPSMSSVAENFVSCNSCARLGTIIWDKFSDGTDNISFENESYLKDKRVIFFMSLLDGDLFAQISLMKILPRQGIMSLHVYLPFFFTGTMERVGEFGPNCLATADTLASILSTDIPGTKTGLVNLIIYDLHTLQNRFYFRNDIMLEMQTGITMLISKLPKTTIIVFPDDGAKKRFGEFFFNFNTVTCSKIRKGDKRIIHCDIDLLPRKVNTENAIIIDDLVQSGATLIECMRALRLQGVKNVSAYVTHVVLPNNAHLKFIDRPIGDHFDKIYHTNSNPTISKRCMECEGNNPFEVLKFEEYIEWPTVKHNIQRDFVDVYVPTTSEVKLSAVYNSMANLHQNVRVFSISNIKSGVHEQPFDNETFNGSLNRSSECYLFLKECHSVENGIIISIENGMFTNEDGSYSDKVVINYVNISSGGGKFICGGDIPVLPTYIPEIRESIAKGENLTYGHLLERDFGYTKDSWHHYFGEKTRSQIISEVLEKLLL